MQKILKYACIAFVVLLFLPIIQRSIKILPRLQLHGTFKQAEKPKLSWNSWMDGSFQSAYETYFNQRQGLRVYFIRVHNQIHYSLFGTAPDTGGTVIVVGKDGYLYEQSYVKLYNTENRYPEEDLRDIARRVRRLQDEVRKMGVGFLLVISPSKVEIYPEHLPEERLLPGRDQRKSTYDVFIPMLKEEGVELIDTKELFVDWKKTEPYPLFARTGTHWNYISAGRVVGLMMDRLSGQLGRSLPLIELIDVKVDRTIYGADNDLGDLMNLWTRKRLAGDQYHPVFRRSPGDGERKPDILIVGDSFCHTIVDVLNNNDLVANTDLFYYFKRLFDSPADEFGSPIRHAELDWRGDIFKRDAIVLQLNEYWLPKVGFGFMDGAFEVLGGPAAPTASEGIENRPY